MESQGYSVRWDALKDEGVCLLVEDPKGEIEAIYSNAPPSVLIAAVELKYDLIVPPLKWH